MIRSFKPHLEVLPPSQRHLWPALRLASSLGFVLYGGTAIALRLGHRTSVDFDFFSDSPLDKLAMKAAFPFLVGATVLQERPETLTVLIPVGVAPVEYVKVSFFGSVGFGRVGEPELTEDGILQVAALDDLMATKLKVILQRIEAKDYQDIAAMVKVKVNLAKGLASARALYGQDFQASEGLKAMVYFKGGDLHTLSIADQQTLINAASSVRDLPAVVISSRVLLARSG